VVASGRNRAPDIEVIGEADTASAAMARMPAPRPDVAFASRQVMARLREHAAAADPVAALSDQEKRVLELIGEGLTNRQIAERMFLAEKTVKNYVSSLLTKLGMQRRTQAAAFSVRHADDQGR
jgi:DNA-binding NarL/FixJ family response regulator